MQKGENADVGGKKYSGYLFTGCKPLLRLHQRPWQGHCAEHYLSLADGTSSPSELLEKKHFIRASAKPYQLCQILSNNCDEELLPLEKAELEYLWGLKYLFMT